MFPMHTRRLFACLMMTIALASQGMAQTGQPIDPAELLRDTILVNEKGDIAITCLGTESNDSIEVSCEYDRIEIELNGKTESFFPRIGAPVSVKICGFDGHDRVSVKQQGPFLSYQLEWVEILGGSGDDDLFANADTLAVLTGGLGADFIQSDCTMSALAGDAIWQTTLGEEVAVDFSPETVIGLGPAPIFVRIAVGFPHKSGMSWDLLGEDRTNEDQNDPNDIFTLFGEVVSDEMGMLVIDHTNDEDWKANIPR